MRLVTRGFGKGVPGPRVIGINDQIITRGFDFISIRIREIIYLLSKLTRSLIMGSNIEKEIEVDTPIKIKVETISPIEIKIESMSTITREISLKSKIDMEKD